MSIEMSCKELAHSFFLFANEENLEGKQILTKSQVKRLNALMQTCGFMMNRVSLLIEWDCLVKAESAEVLLFLFLPILS
jgi:glutaminase